MTEHMLIDVLKALAHPLRYRILVALTRGEMNVGEIEQDTGIVQPGLSQQLGVLRKSGLVETRKDAKLVFYRIQPALLKALATRLLALGPETGPVTSSSVSRAPASGAANFARMT